MSREIPLQQTSFEKDFPVPSKVNSPSHYNRGRIEVIDMIKESLSTEAYEGFLAGNVIKYMTRYQLKGGLEDLQKANWYLARLIELKSEAKPDEEIDFEF